MKLELVRKYIYNEIPILVCGIDVSHIHYRVLYYCGSKNHLAKFANDENSLHHLVMDIYTKPEFADIFKQIVANSVNQRIKVPGFVGIEI